MDFFNRAGQAESLFSQRTCYIQLARSAVRIYRWGVNLRPPRAAHCAFSVFGTAGFRDRFGQAAFYCNCRSPRWARPRDQQRLPPTKALTQIPPIPAIPLDPRYSRRFLARLVNCEFLSGLVWLMNEKPKDAADDSLYQARPVAEPAIRARVKDETKSTRTAPEAEAHKAEKARTTGWPKEQALSRGSAGEGNPSSRLQIKEKNGGNPWRLVDVAAALEHQKQVI